MEHGGVEAIFFCPGGPFWGARRALVWVALLIISEGWGRFWDVYTGVKAKQSGCIIFDAKKLSLVSKGELPAKKLCGQSMARMISADLKQAFHCLPAMRATRKSYHHSLSSLPYFFVAAASSALAFALFSLTPTNLASLLASLNLLYAPSSPSGISPLLTSPTASSLRKFLIGNTPCTCLAAFSFSNLEISSLLLSAPLCWPERRGKRIKRSR